MTIKSMKSITPQKCVNCEHLKKSMSLYIPALLYTNIIHPAGSMAEVSFVARMLDTNVSLLTMFSRTTPC